MRRSPTIVAGPAPSPVASPAALKPSSNEALRDVPLHVVTALSYGFIAGSAARDAVMGLLLIAIFAACSSMRALFRSRWLLAVVAIMTVASWRVPWVATAIGAATLLLLAVRLGFVVKNLRLVVSGLVAYAVPLAAVGATARSGHAVVELVPLPLDDAALGAWLSALVIACLAAGFISLVLSLSYRGGYTTARALEIISILPLLVLGSVLPFVDHASLWSSWQAGATPSLASVMRVPPSFGQSLDVVRGLLLHVH